MIGSQNLGAWAVAGFFALSGYLITASRQRAPFGEFLLLRIARLYPAFLTVLVVTVAFFGPIAHFINQNTFAGYLRTPVSPFNYFFLNMGLEVNSYSIGSTLSNVPFPNVWNGSLWTLYYEFLCYLLVGIILFSKKAKTSPWPIALAFLLCSIAYIKSDFVVSFFDGSTSAFQLLSLAPYFLGGALIRMVMPYIGFHWIPGVLSLSIAIVGNYAGPAWTPQVLAPFLAYGLIWLSTVIPQPKLIATNDFSYGVYVYAFPVQQLLAAFGLVHLDAFVFSVLALGITFCFAAASWFAVERPSLRRIRLSLGRSADR